MVSPQVIEETFKAMDTAGFGQVPAARFIQVVKAHGMYITDKEALNILGSKADGGTIDFKDFQQLMGKRLENHNAETELIKMLKKFDRDSKGTVSAKEFHHVMKTLSEQMSETDVDHLMTLADPDRTGKVNYSNLVKELLL